MNVTEALQHALQRLKQLRTLAKQLEEQQTRQQHSQASAVTASMKAAQADLWSCVNGISTTHSSDAVCKLVVDKLKVGVVSISTWVYSVLDSKCKWHLDHLGAATVAIDVRHLCGLTNFLTYWISWALTATCTVCQCTGTSLFSPHPSVLHFSAVCVTPSLVPTTSPAGAAACCSCLHHASHKHRQRRGVCGGPPCSAPTHQMGTNQQHTPCAAG